ncbi:MAG TPA: molybdenum ABC transporter ATP-binding protein [Burkholderiales bacterium]|nr:molybdenum ABC transporter ATP-binding protein [Burkholderiales bacterium]
MTLSIDIERRLGNFQLQAKFDSASGVTALFGRSGAGKSMLVNVIAGLLRPDRGRVEINGATLFDSERGVDMPAQKRRIGYVFQEGRLFPHMTVRQNLVYGRFFTTARERYVGLDQVIGLLGLEHLLERRPAALSGGEKQRVAIGRALLSSPRVLLMDEPLASLDIHRKSEILQYIESLRGEVNIPIVYVSHAIEEVVRLAETMVLLSGGKVLAAGKLEDIMSRLDLRPMVGRYEAGAVIDTRVTAYDEKFELTTLSFGGGEISVAHLDALVGEPVRVRIRARDVALALHPPAGISMLNVLRGRLIEISGEEGPVADVRVQVGEAWLVARLTRLSIHQLGLEPGQEVYALIKAVALDRHSFGFA